MRYILSLAVDDSLLTFEDIKHSAQSLHCSMFGGFVHSDYLIWLYIFSIKIYPFSLVDDDDNDGFMYSIATLPI